MKTYGKRLLSLLLCCVLLLGLLPAAVFAEGEPDTTAPVLTAGAVNRTSDTAATVKFTSNEAGNYYYAVVDAGAEAPAIDTTVEGTPCDTSEQTISLTLTAGAKDVYIVVKDAAENVSLPLKIAVPAFAVNLFAAFAALTETTTLPASFDYTLGSEPPYSVGDETGYAKLLKVEIAEADVGKTLTITFAAKTGTSPFPISVFDDISGTADPVAFGVGRVSYSLTKAGTYYIALAGPGGECHAELSITGAPTATDLFAAFAALTETTTLPASFDYTLGSEPPYTVGTEADYAKLLKVEIAEADVGKALNITFAAKTGTSPLGILVFDDISGTADPVAIGVGRVSYSLTKAGTYYIALAGPGGECHAELSLTTAPTELTAGFKALTETTTLPASFDYTLGSENTFYTYTFTDDEGYKNTYTVSAKLMKVELEAASALRVSFAGVEDSVDTTLWLFSESDGVFTLIDRVDNDSLNGGGESTLFTLEDAGTYYLALASHCENENGPCHAEISLTTPPEVIPMVDGFKALTETTTLPASFDYTLGSENTLYTHTLTYDDGYKSTYTVSAKLMKVELEANSFLSVSFAGVEEDVDTTLWLFSESDGVFTLIKRVDNDSLNGDGESTRFDLEDAGTYYLALASHCDSENGPCHGEVSVISYANAYMGDLDFTADPVPVPAEGDKWSWDPETKTLTLKDGFSIYCKDDDAITLPDGSVVVVEGEAMIFSGYDEGIEGENLTIRGGAGSRLTISASDDGISCDDILIEDCALNIQSGYNGVLAYGSITVRRSVLNIDSEDECLDSDYSGKGVTIENSTLRLVSNEEGIETYEGDITITGSDVNIDTSSEEEGIYASGVGNITVTGGRLVIAARKEALEGNKVTLSNVVFDLRTVRDYDLLDMDSPDGFSLPGTLRLYDLDGNLLYEGEWKDELLNGDTLYVDNTRVTRAVTVQEHTWSEDWTTDDTHHWHECTDPYCMLTENADKDGYGDHEGELKNAKPATATEDGYTGDTVCKVCGKLLAAGQVIPATGEQPTNPSEPVNPNNPGTGDGSHLLLWIALLLTSCVGIVVTTVSVRKRIVK